MTTLKVVCAWCGVDLGEKDGKGEEGVSHGMCEKCFAKVRSQRGKVGMLEEELAGLNAQPNGEGHRIFESGNS